MSKSKKTQAKARNKATFKKTLLIGGIVTAIMMYLMYNMFQGAL